MGNIKTQEQLTRKLMINGTELIGIILVIMILLLMLSVYLFIVFISSITF